MSAEARKLVELTEASEIPGRFAKDFSRIDVAQVLKDHPELQSGLNEYLAWRDEENRAIAETKQTAPIAHSIQESLKRLRPRKLRRRKKR
jgi:hypothetical protein